MPATTDGPIADTMTVMVAVRPDANQPVAIKTARREMTEVLRRVATAVIRNPQAKEDSAATSRVNYTKRRRCLKSKSLSCRTTRASIHSPGKSR